MMPKPCCGYLLWLSVNCLIFNWLVVRLYVMYYEFAPVLKPFQFLLDMLYPVGSTIPIDYSLIYLLPIDLVSVREGILNLFLYFLFLLRHHVIITKILGRRSI